MRIATFYQFQQASNLISKQFDTMNKLLLQNATGSKILASSDDPVLAQQIKAQKNYLDSLDSYKNNALLAQSRYQIFSASIQNSVNVAQDISTQITRIQGALLTPANQQAVAQQLQTDLSLMLTYANTTDANGTYIYSGYHGDTQPYVLLNGSYQYQGGTARTYIDIGDNVNTMFYESGNTVYSDIFDGNGVFKIAANNANVGDAFLSPGTVVNQSTYVADTYTLSFVTNGSGELAYQVVGATSGQVIPPLPATVPSGAPKFDPKTDIAFNGISFTVEGTPQVGDSFTIQPSQTENVFNTLQGLIDTLQSPPANKGVFNQILTQYKAAFEQINEHFITYQSQVGSMAASVNNQVTANDALVVNAASLYSNLGETHFEEVSSALLQKQFALQATTSGYLKLQDTLMRILQL